MTYRILAINPGSTSTKFAVYDGENQILSKTLNHSVEELSKFNCIMDQFEMRKNEIENRREGYQESDTLFISH